MSPLRRAIRWTIRVPAVAAVAGRTFEVVGADALADRVDRVRSDGGLVPVTLPPPPRALHPRRFRMHALEERDQVARAVRSGGWLGFEAPLPSVAVHLVRRWPDMVLDVGANTGFYSLLAVTAHPAATVLAFEPVPEIAQLLRDNLDVNAQGRRVTVREVAVGDASGPVAIHLPPAQGDGTVETSASLDPSFKGDIARTLTVEGTTLDAAWQAAGCPTVSFVKIDVEGVEPRVLAGSGELRAACRPTLAIEVLRPSDLGALERLRADEAYVDVALGAHEVVVDPPHITADGGAPNHLFVPRERLADVVDELRRIPHLTVTTAG